MVIEDVQRKKMILRTGKSGLSFQKKKKKGRNKNKTKKGEENKKEEKKRK